MCYSDKLIHTAIRCFTKLKLDVNQSAQQQPMTKDNPIRGLRAPFQRSKISEFRQTSIKRSELKDKINIELNPVYTSRKLKEQIKIKEF